MVQRDNLTVDGSVIADNRTTNGSASGGGISFRGGQAQVFRVLSNGGLISYTRKN